MQPLLNIAISAARVAGDIIMRHFDTIDHLEVMAKNEHEFFTEVDVKSEQAIIQTILKKYPDHGIIAEESGSINPDAETVWIIDPLDGTSNFIHGFPFFSISIAIRVKNRIEHGVIYDPIRHECFMASRGCGARLNDRRIRVSKRTQLIDALIGTGVPMRNLSVAERFLPPFQALFGKCGGIRRTGSAALDLAYVAAGRMDGFWEFGLKPWDIAAGCLIIQEAGGLVSDMEGGEKYLTKGDVVAGNPKVFKSLLQVIVNASQPK